MIGAVVYPFSHKPSVDTVNEKDLIMQQKDLTIFEDFKIRRRFDENSEKWYFSIIDIIAALIEQKDYQTARKYWNKLKERLKKEGSETVTNCHQLKMIAQDGKMRFTDVA